MRTLTVLFVSGTSVLLPVTGYAQMSLRTVMLTGDPAPSDLPGAVFTSLVQNYTPVINNYGRVSFGAFLNVGQFGTWSHSSQQFLQLARSGGPAPGSGNTFSTFSSSNISDSGQVSFGSLISPQSRAALVRYSPQQGSLIAIDNTAAPGTPAANYSGVCSRNGNLLAPPAMNAAGDVSYYSLLNTGSYGLYKTAPGGTVQVARQNNFVTGLPFVRWAALGTADLIGENSSSVFPTLNDVGINAFFGRLSGSGVTAANENSIWTHSTTLNLRARGGDNPPGFDPGVQFLNFGNPAINNAGQLAFGAVLAGTGIDQNNDTGIWSNVQGQFAPVAREGDIAPGFGSNFKFTAFRSADSYDPIINSNGDVSFVADVTGPGITAQNDSGLWAQRNGLLTLLAREGDQAPGTPTGTLFSESTFGDFFPQMNSLGQLVFKASLAGPGVSTANDQGLWALLEDGSVHLLVREGDTLEIRPGVFRTLGPNAFVVRGPSGGQDGRPRTLSDAGEFVLRATFTTGEQAILVLDIPEPASACMLMIAMAASVCRKRTARLRTLILFPISSY